MNSQSLNVPECFYRVSVKALILDDSRQKFMIIKEEKGVWELPGGGLDWGVSAQEDLKREIQEEMGLETPWIAERPSYFLTCKNQKGIWVANVIFEAKVADLNFTPSDECVEIRFVTSDEIPSLNALPNVVILAKQFDPNNHA